MLKKKIVLNAPIPSIVLEIMFEDNSHPVKLEQKDLYIDKNGKNMSLRSQSVMRICREKIPGVPPDAIIKVRYSVEQG